MKLGSRNNKNEGLRESRRMKYLVFGLYLSRMCEDLGFMVLQNEAKVVG